MNLEIKYDKFYKILTIVSSLVCIMLFGMAAIEENFLREWKNYQQEFKGILISKAETEKELEVAQEFPVEIKQIILNDFNKVDRCVSCHNGIENPKMADQPIPHAVHSGNYLKYHPVEKFGCSICHGGQDRALAIKNAFAQEEGVHWEYPVLPLEYAQSSCGKCHLSVFDKSQTLAGAGILMQGRDVFYEQGCLGCHSVRGTGGTNSFELTDQGSKTKHEYSFKNVEGEHTVHNWLLEHFLDPQRVSEISEMPAMTLDEEKMDALITFVLGLQTPEFTADYYSLNLISEFKNRRKKFENKDAYDAICAVCHGENGEGKDYRVFEASVPALNNQDFLAVASEQMLEFTITKGRSGRTMSAWGEAHGGLSKTEIAELVAMIRNWKKAAPGYAEVRSAKADLNLGANLYRSRCGTCHGPDGEGGIGPSLNNQDLLALADDKFLYNTIVNGRANTAMLSWSQLSANEISSLIALLNSWQQVPAIQLSDKRIYGNIKEGETLFATMCSGCHGRYGEGSVGPAILNNDFLKAASDEFILHSISRGRSQSAMRSWAKEFQGMEQLTKQEINNIVAFMRSQENVEHNVIYAGVTAGTPSNGKVLFEGMCAGCHGVNGEGKHGPALNNQEFLNAASDGFLQATIAIGRAGTAMRSWAKGAQGYEELSAEQINDIVTYIRSWQKQVIALRD